MDTSKYYKLRFASVYPHYVNKVVRKGRTNEEVDEVIFWFTGYDEVGMQKQIDLNTTFEVFFATCPKLNPNSSKITGVVCGIRVEDIEDELVRNIRYLDKLIDELAKGKTMEKILRA